MGKRKKSSRKPTGPRKREPLATSFRCVFCNHESSVSVKIDKKASIGSLSCKSCQRSFQANTNYLSQPVDVYSDWIDACDAVADGGQDEAPPPAHRSTMHQPQSSARAGLAPGEKYTAEDDGFIDNDEEDPEADFADD